MICLPLIFTYLPKSFEPKHAKSSIQWFLCNRKRKTSKTQEGKTLIRCPIDDTWLLLLTFSSFLSPVSFTTCILFYNHMYVWLQKHPCYFQLVTKAFSPVLHLFSDSLLTIVSSRLGLFSLKMTFNTLHMLILLLRNHPCVFLIIIGSLHNWR